MTVLPNHRQSATTSVDHLGFGTDAIKIELPRFQRTAWASDQARAAWEHRISAAAKAWQKLEWHAAIEGVRPCAVIDATAQALIDHGSIGSRGVVHLPLACFQASSPPSDKPQLHYRTVVGSMKHVREFQDAFDHKDDERLAELLGCPPCCRKTFRDVWIELGIEDPTWSIACNSTPTLSSSQDTATKTSANSRLVELDTTPYGNIFWRWLGLRLVPHIPCTTQCIETAKIGEEYKKLGRVLGLSREYDDIVEILHWPLEWSALHGIAEVRTPVLKFIVPTDGTRTKYVVRWNGNNRPKEAAKGLDFVYQAPSRPKVTESANYKLGLNNPI